jgi:hypothetical protein
MLVPVRLKRVLILTQDRCTIYNERTIGSKIIFDAPDGTPRWRGSYEISFRSVWRRCWCRCKIGAWFVPNVPQAQKSFWMHPMVLLGCEAQVKARFGPFGDSSNLDVRYVRGFQWKYHRLEHYFRRTRLNCSVMWVLGNLVAVIFEMVFVSVQDRCRVCVKRTIRSDIILDTLDGTPRLRGSSGSSFRSVWR